MLFGGRAAFFPETDQTVRQSAEILRRGMIEVYPQLSDAKIEYVWGGTLDFAFDIMPHAGQIDGMYFAVGYAGHGVAMATYQGQKIAELMAGDKPENPYWINIDFPRFHARIYVSYKKVEGNYDKLREDAYKMTYKHTYKSSSIED